MPEFNCGACGRLLKTPAGTEGKKGKCPHCKAVMSIPGGDGRQNTAGNSQTGNSQAGKSQPAGQRRPVAPGSGLPQRPLDPASGTPVPPQPTMAPPKSWSTTPYAQAGKPQHPIGSQAANPYASPGQMRPAHLPQRARPTGTPHRGPLVLTLSIVSLVFSLLAVVCFCAFPFSLPPAVLSLAVGVPALLLGRGDLTKMNRNQMDASGFGTTNAGVILSIIGIVLSTLGVIASIALFAIILFADAA